MRAQRWKTAMGLPPQKPRQRSPRDLRVMKFTPKMYGAFMPRCWYKPKTRAWRGARQKPHWNFCRVSARAFPTLRRRCKQSQTRTSPYITRSSPPPTRRCANCARCGSRRGKKCAKRGGEGNRFMKLVTANQMRAFEQRADASGNSYAAMMERAGTLTAHAITERFAVRDQRVLVLVGPGNNGGDGLVCARVLHDAGARVALYVWRRVPAQSDVNWELCMRRNIPFTRAEDDADFSKLAAELAQAHFIIDALLGTGVTRPIEGMLREVLETVKNSTARANRSGENLLTLTRAPNRPIPQSPHPPIVIAVDLPTGLNPDTGA